MEAWDKGEFDMLVQANVTNIQAKLSVRQDGQPLERCVRKFQADMLKGGARGAVTYLTEMDKGGVLLPDDTYNTPGIYVLEVLRLKHPYTMPPVLSSLHPYDATLDMCALDVTHDTIQKVARNLPGSSGLGGVDSHAVSHWLLAFGNASVTLCHSLANWLTPYHHWRLTERYGREVC
jgi:hypothetical protein